MVPILDVKVKLDDEGKLIYKFYQKPCVNRQVVNKNSAIPLRTKFTILTQECFRRLHNSSDELDMCTKCDILSEYMKDLKISGYNEHERKFILEGGIKTI